MTTSTVRTGFVEVNGAKLYHEIRGEGPLVVFISGGGGDAGVYTAIAELLADTYTTVTYDRRGNSRSPRPDGWTATTMAEQADDCAALIESLELERPVLFGSSLGGTILVAFLERHAGALRGTIVHEPGLASVSPSAEAFTAKMTELVMEGLANGDVTGEGVGRWLFGDTAFDAIPEEIYERNQRSPEVNLTVDGPAMMAFVPGEAPNVEVPVHGARGVETTHAFLLEGAEWVSRTFGSQLLRLPGGHIAYMDRPGEFGDALRPILEEMA